MSTEIDVTRPIRQRNGRKAVYIGKSQSEKFPLVIDCLDDDGEWLSASFSPAGQNRWAEKYDEISGSDIINYDPVEDVRALVASWSEDEKQAALDAMKSDAA